MSDQPLRRLPLRQLLASSDKCARELNEKVHTHFLTRLADCRDLSRPVRRKSHYPTVTALMNGMKHLQEAADQVKVLSAHLKEHLDTIRDHAQREKLNRRI
jgi:hypothetical protein